MLWGSLLCLCIGTGSGFAGLEVERPEQPEFYHPLGIDIMMGREVIRRIEPAHRRILYLYENAGTLPLGVDEEIDDGPVLVASLVLIVEDAQSRVPGRGIPGGVVEHIGPYLHLQHLLSFVVALNDELDEILSIEGKPRQRHHILVGRDLEQELIVQMQEIGSTAETAGIHLWYGYYSTFSDSDYPESHEAEWLAAAQNWAGQVLRLPAAVLQDGWTVSYKIEDYGSNLVQLKLVTEEYEICVWVYQNSAKISDCLIFNRNWYDDSLKLLYL